MALLSTLVVVLVRNECLEPGEKGLFIIGGGCSRYCYSESGTAGALLSQTWARVEASPATEAFAAVTKNNLEDQATSGALSKAWGVLKPLVPWKLHA